MRIAICDDEPYYGRQINDCLDSFSAKYGKTFEVYCYSSSTGFLSVVTREKFDVIFLDISMPEIDGLTIAQYIRKTDDTVHIVFVTNLEGKMPQGYHVMAAGFLIKPIRAEDIDHVMDRLVQWEERKLGAPYEIKCKGGGTAFLPLREVLYFESLGHYILAKTKTDQYEFRGKLTQEYPRLSEHGFVQSHRAYLVNMAYIWILADDSITLTDSSTLPVGAKFLGQLKDKYRSYKRGG